MRSRHNRKIVFSGIDLVGAKFSHTLKIMPQLTDSLEQLMIDSGYLDEAPFLWVGTLIRYGVKNEKAPHYQRINKKYGDLPLGIEIDARVFVLTDKYDPLLLKDFFEIVALDCLIHAGKKYKLKIDRLVERRKQLGEVPDWDPMMEENSDLIEQAYKGLFQVEKTRQDNSRFSRDCKEVYGYVTGIKVDS